MMASSNVSYDEVSASISWTVAFRRPRRSLPRRSRYSYEGRKPVPKYICLRVRTTLTGRFISRAASAATTVCGQQRSPLPKAPPTKGLMTRTESSGTSNTVESSVWVPTTHCVLSHTVSLFAVPAGDGGVRLHRVVVVARHPVRQVHPHRRLAQAGLGVTARVLGRLARLGLGQVGRGLLGVIADLHQARAVLRGLQRGGHHDGDRLAVEEDLVVLEDPQPAAGKVVRPGIVAVRQLRRVAVMDHPQHARMGLRHHGCRRR